MKINLALLLITLLIIITAIWYEGFEYFWYGLLVSISLTFISLVMNFIVKRKSNYYELE